MTIHHWNDPLAGFASCAGCWIARSSLPGARITTRSIGSCPSTSRSTNRTLEIPTDGSRRRRLWTRTPCWSSRFLFDFADGYQPAWRRPEAYLEPSVRNASSTFATLPDRVVLPAMRRLANDLADGSWVQRHRHLLDSEVVDWVSAGCERPTIHVIVDGQSIGGQCTNRRVTEPSGASGRNLFWWRSSVVSPGFRTARSAVSRGTRSADWLPGLTPTSATNASNCARRSWMRGRGKSPPRP